MKQRINGISYDTEKCEQIVELKPLSPNRADLCQTPSGHFFISEIRYYLKGRRVPDSMPQLEFHRKCIIHPRRGRYRLAPNVEERVIIKPIPRRRALALTIRARLPRTFRKELAQFLK
jgi:hypothetical protein